MPVNKATKELLKKEIESIKENIKLQENVVADLKKKYDRSFAIYNDANDKLVMIKEYLRQYKEDMNDNNSPK